MARPNHELLSALHEVYSANGNGNGGGGDNGQGSEKKFQRHRIKAQDRAKQQQFVDQTKEARYLRGLAKRNGNKSGDRPAKVD